MRFTTVLVAVAASAGLVSAQNGTTGGLNATYIGAIVSALAAANLTMLAGAAQSIAATPQGIAFLSQLQGSNKTLLAPSDAAFAMVDPSVLSNTTLVTQILSYHVLNTSVTSIPKSPAHGIYRSLLNQGTLPNNLTAPVVLTGSNSTNGTASVLYTNTSANVLAGPVPAANFMIYIIDQVLTTPPDLGTLAGELVPSLAGVLTQVGLVAPLLAIKGITVFAPIDSAIASVASTLGMLNSSLVTSVLANHVINGTAVYSTGLLARNYTSAGGEPFTFISNSTGTFVQSGMSVVQIVQSDIIANNGVVHAINGVLLNTASNSTAAAAAASSNAAAVTSAASTASGVVGTATAAASSTAAKSAGNFNAQISMGAIGGVVLTLAGVAFGALLL